VAGFGLALYALDEYEANIISRSARSFFYMALIMADYKINFKEGSDVEALHERSAKRLFHVISKNKGLYVKFGQAIAVQASIFPPPLRDTFTSLFDDAPASSWTEVSKALENEYGGKEAVDEIFDTIDPRPIASASIAQVHKAKLNGGQEVALKVRHPAIKKQMQGDLIAYRIIMRAFGWAFSLPMGVISDFVAEKVLEETDFRLEAQNSSALKSFCQNDSRFNGRIYIPEIYTQYTTASTLVMEFVQGVRMSDREAVSKAGFSHASTMRSVLQFFAAQIFSFGIVHADPHPGNFLLRYDPKSGKPQIVVLDHGLYVYERPEFRIQYTYLWKYLLSYNIDGVKQILECWGMEYNGSMGQAIIARNYDPNKKKLAKTGQDTDFESFAHQKDMSESFKNFIKSTDKLPLELVFVGRSVRILQGLNLTYGSPVNRINIFAGEAYRAIASSQQGSVLSKLSLWRMNLVFGFSLLVSDIVFYLLRLRQIITYSLFGIRSRGMEDLMD
ncbi:hypothetical protein CANCADRAFT_18635, partial [Tortispora caseinolytica NRRL Y-17796]